MMISRTCMATALCCAILLCAPSALAQPPAANQMPSVIQVPAEAQATALQCHRSHERLPRADSCRQDGPFRRLLRGRLLDDSLGLSLRSRSRAAVAESEVVRAHARSGGASHSLQAGAHVRVLV